MISIIICEEETDVCKYLEIELVKICNPTQFKISKYYDEISLLLDLKNYNDNCIFFIDISLHNANGIELAKIINDQFSKSLVIFFKTLQNKNNNMLEDSYTYFISNPKIEKHLSDTINGATNYFEKSKQLLNIKLKDRLVFIQQEKIIYLERVGRITYIHTTEKIYKESLKLIDLLGFLKISFVQCHRNYILNIAYVREYSRTEFVLNNNEIVPISRSFSKGVFDYYQNYQSYSQK